MDGIAILIDELRGNTVKRRTISENAHQFVQNFGWARLAEDYCQLYTEIIQEKTLNAPVSASFRLKCD